jgi:hypothetical protein
MREKLNSNPMAQLAVIGVLLAGAALLMMTMMGGGSSTDSAAESSVATTTPPATATATSATTTPPATATAPTATPTATGLPAAPAVPATAPVVPDPPPLPDDVVSAHEAGKTVAILLIHPSAPEDRLLEKAVRSIGDPGVAVFVAPVERIATFASITQGVNLDRVPALIVVKPKAVSGGQPTAIVRYGFRNPESVVQAVKDAIYVGASKTYSPE